MKFKQYIAKEKKSAGRVVALLLACTMVAGFALPFGASAEWELHSGDGSTVDETGDEPGPGYSESNNDLVATVGLSTLTDALRREKTIQTTLEPEAASVPVGQPFNVRVSLKFNNWLSYRYKESATSAYNPILNTVSGVKLKLYYPDTMEYIPNSDDLVEENHADYLLIALDEEFSTNYHGSQSVDVAFRMKGNGSVSDGTDYAFSAVTEGDVDIVTAYGGSEYKEIVETVSTTIQDETLVPEATCTVKAEAWEKWGMSKKTDGDPKGTSETVTFRFVTDSFITDGAGNKYTNLAGKLIGNSEESEKYEFAYDRYGRRFFDEYEMSEYLTLIMQADEQGAETKTVQLAPESVKFDYEDYNPSLTGEMDGPKDLTGSWGEISDLLPITWSAQSFYKQCIPGKSNRVELSPGYTKYVMTVTYRIEDLKRAALDAGIMGSFLFWVTSGATLSYRIDGQSHAPEDDATQMYRIGKEGGTINISVQKHESYTDNYPTRLTQDDAVSDGFGFELWGKKSGGSEYEKLDGVKPVVRPSTDAQFGTVFSFEGLGLDAATQGYRDFQVKAVGDVTGYTFIDGQNTEVREMVVGQVGTTDTKTAIFSVWKDNKYTLTLYKVKEYQAGSEKKQEPLKDVGFTLKSADGKVTIGMSTDDNGMVRFTDLRRGEYTITETSQPLFYEPNSATYHVTVGGAEQDMVGVYDEENNLVGTRENPIANYSMLGTILLKKRVAGFKLNDKTYTPDYDILPKPDTFKFKLYGDEQGTTSSGIEATADAQGNVLFTGVQQGEWWIKETATVGWSVEYEGMTANEHGLIGPVKMERGAAVTVEATAVNIEHKGYAVVQKTYMDGSNVTTGHASFLITNSTGEEVKFDRVSDGYYRVNQQNGEWYVATQEGTGLLILEGLDPSQTYTITENSAPWNCVLPPEGERTQKLKVVRVRSKADLEALLSDANKVKIPNQKAKVWEGYKKDVDDTYLGLGGAELFFYTMGESGSYDPYLWRKSAQSEELEHVRGKSDRGTGKLSYVPSGVMFVEEQEYYILEADMPIGYQAPPEGTEKQIRVLRSQLNGKLPALNLDENQKVILYGPFKPQEDVTFTVYNKAKDRAVFQFQKLRTDTGEVVSGTSDLGWFQVKYGNTVLDGFYKNEKNGNLMPFSQPFGYPSFPGGDVIVEVIIPGYLTDAWKALEEKGSIELTISEVKAPSGYESTKETTTVVAVSKDGTAEIQIAQLYNAPFGKLVSVDKYSGSAKDAATTQRQTADFKLYERENENSAWKQVTRGNYGVISVNGGTSQPNFPLRPGYQYALAETSGTQERYNGIRVEIGGESVTVTDGAVEIDGKKAFLLPLRTAERPYGDVKIIAYNYPEVSVTMNKLDIETNEMIDQPLLKNARFELYRVKQGSAADYFELSLEEIAKNPNLVKLENVQQSTGKGTVTFSKIAPEIENGSAILKQELLIVETVAPHDLENSYVLDDAAYQAVGATAVGNTRRGITVDFASGATTFSVSEPMKNASSKLLHLSKADIRLQLGFNEPYAEDGLPYPLQEYGQTGADVTVTLQNNTTMLGMPLSLATLYDYTLEQAGKIQYFDKNNSEITGNEVVYSLKEVRIPGAYFTGTMGSDVRQYVGVKVYNDSGSMIAQFGAEAAAQGPMVVGAQLLGGTKWVKIVYGDEKGSVGANFVAEAVEIDLNLQYSGVKNVATVRSDSKLSFHYYQREGGDEANKISMAATANNSITVPETWILPSAAITKRVSHESESSEGTDRAPVFTARVEDMVDYTIEAKIGSRAPFTQAAIVDQLPPHLTLDASTVKVEGPANDVSFSKGEEQGFACDIIVVRFREELPEGSTVRLTFSAELNPFAPLLGSRVSNTAYMTSLKPLLPPTDYDPTGQTFTDESGQVPGVHSQEITKVLGESANLGYVTAGADFTFGGASSGGLTKIVKGELDSGFVNSEKMAYTGNNGLIYYRIRYVNGSKNAALQNVRMGDLLPSEDDNRVSGWRPTLTGDMRVSAGENTIGEIYVTDQKLTQDDVGALVQSGGVKENSKWAKLSGGNEDQLKNARAFIVEFTKPLGPAEVLELEFTMRAPLWSDGEFNQVTADTKTANNEAFFCADGMSAATRSINTKVTARNNVGLGDRVWFDVNANGIQDEGETGVKDVQVTLYRYLDGAEQFELRETHETDEEGIYLEFTSLPITQLDAQGKPTRGDYTFELEFSNLPANMRITKKNAGTDGAKDSDVSPDSGRTGQFRFVNAGGKITTQFISDGRGTDFPAARNVNPDFDCGLIMGRKATVSIEKALEGTSAFDTGDQFTFELYPVENGALGNVLSSVTIEADKGATFMQGDEPIELPVGDYAIRETAIVDADGKDVSGRYELNGITGSLDTSLLGSDAYQFTVNNDREANQQNLKVSFKAVNEIKTGSLTITKRLVESQTPVEGDKFTFRLYRVAGEQGIPVGVDVEIEAVPDRNTHTFYNLPLGEYIIEEAGSSGYQFNGWKLPDGSTDATAQHQFELTGDVTDLSFTAVNKMVEGDLSITKNLTGYVTNADRAAQFSFDLDRAEVNGGTLTIHNHVTTVAVSNRGGTVGYTVQPGTYAVSEQNYSGYTFQGFEGSAGGQVMALGGKTYYVFTITNDGETPTVRINATNRTSSTPPTTPDRPDRPDRDRPTRDTPDDTPDYAPNTPDLIDIPDEPVPLAQDPLIDIPDEPVPLAGLPDMGGFTPMHLVPLGGLLIVAGFLLTRKKKGPNGENR